MAPRCASPAPRISSDWLPPKKQAFIGEQRNRSSLQVTPASCILWISMDRTFGSLVEHGLRRNCRGSAVNHGQVRNRDNQPRREITPACISADENKSVIARTAYRLTLFAPCLQKGRKTP